MKFHGGARRYVCFLAGVLLTQLFGLSAGLAEISHGYYTSVDGSGEPPHMCGYSNHSSDADSPDFGQCPRGQCCHKQGPGGVCGPCGTPCAHYPCVDAACTICCSGARACDHTCCPEGTDCVGYDGVVTCCPRNRQCGIKCCEEGEACVEGECRPVECDPSTRFCRYTAECCAVGEKCLADGRTCCTAEKACGNECCSAEQICDRSITQCVTCPEGRLICNSTCCQEGVSACGSDGKCPASGIFIR